MARRDTQVFYPSYQSFVPKLLNRPWTAEDGMAPEELNTQVLSSVAAKQLEEFGNTPTVATITPMALQEFYLALGISEMMEDRKSTRLNSSHVSISYAVFCLKKK